MRRIAVVCLATSSIFAGCGGAATAPATSIPTAAAVPASAAAAATTAAPPGGAATAAGGSTAPGGATGTLNITLTGGLSGTLTEVKSVGLCTDPTKTGGGYAASFSSALGSVPYSFQVGVGATSFKGPGSYSTGGDVMVSVRGATIREIWDAAAGGALTVAADGSGTVDTDLKSATGSPSVHAKGTFSCKR